MQAKAVLIQIIIRKTNGSSIMGGFSGDAPEKLGSMLGSLISLSARSFGTHLGC